MSWEEIYNKCRRRCQELADENSALKEQLKPPGAIRCDHKAFMDEIARLRRERDMWKGRYEAQTSVSAALMRGESLPEDPAQGCGGSREILALREDGGIRRGYPCPGCPDCTGEQL